MATTPSDAHMQTHTLNMNTALGNRDTYLLYEWLCHMIAPLENRADKL